MNRLLCVLMVCVLVAMCLSGISSNAEAEEGGIETLGTAVQVKIHNSYAITEVTKRLVNNGEVQSEHTCLFSVPETAFVSNLTIEIGNETFYSIAVPKDLAEAVYNYQVEIGATASLVSSRGTTLYTHKIMLEPGEEATIRFRFEQMIPKRLGTYGYRMNPDPDARNASFEFSALVHYKDDVSNMTADGLADPDIEYEKSNKVLVTDAMDGKDLPDAIFLNWSVAQPPPEGRMIFYEDGENGYFMHIFSPSVDQVGGEIIPKQIEFCLDKSGSMSGEKIEQLKEAFSGILPALDGADMFGVVTFNEKASEPISDSIMTATGENTLVAVNVVNAMTADGSTDIGLAVETGLDQLKQEEVPNPILVLLTDGQPTAGIVDRDALRAHIRSSNTVGAKIFCLGFGADVDYQLLEAISLENGGEAVRIYADRDAADQITTFYAMISVTLLSGVEFEYSPNAKLWQPGNVTCLFKGSDAIITGLYPKGQDSITAYVNGTTQQGPTYYSREFDTDPDPDDEYVSRFWGYSRIMHLKDRITVLGEQETLVNETIALAIRYNFVTDYTSYVGGDAVAEALEALDPGMPQQLVTYGGGDPDGGSVMPTPGIGFGAILMLMTSIALLAGRLMRRRK